MLLRAMRRHAAARAAFADALASNWENKHAHVNLANLLHYNIYDAASASGAELAAEAISSATRHYLGLCAPAVGSSSAAPASSTRAWSRPSFARCEGEVKEH